MNKYGIRHGKELHNVRTNIFIHWFNNDKQTIEKLEKFGLDRIAVSVITVMELIEGVDNKEQLQQLKRKIKHYNIVDFYKSFKTCIAIG